MTALTIPTYTTDIQENDWELVQEQLEQPDDETHSPNSIASIQQPVVQLDRAQELAEIYLSRNKPVSRAARKRMRRRQSKSRHEAAKRSADSSRQVEQRHKSVLVSPEPVSDSEAAMEMSGDEKIVQDMISVDDNEVVSAVSESVESAIDASVSNDEVLSLPKIAHEKGAMLYYRRKSDTPQPPLLVKVLGVHYDDFPNIYYTIACRPANEQPYLHGDMASFPIFEERQTDNKYLYAIDYEFTDCSLAPAPLEQQQESVEEEDTTSGKVNNPPQQQQQQHEELLEEQLEEQQQQSNASPCRRVPTQTLPVQVRELNTSYLLQARAPGVGISDLNITVEGSLLVIKAFSHTLGMQLQQEVKFPEVADLPRSAVRLIGGIMSIQVPKIVRRTRPMNRNQFFF